MFLQISYTIPASLLLYHCFSLNWIFQAWLTAQQQQQSGSDSKSSETSLIQKEAEQKMDRCQICSTLVADLKQHNGDTHHTRVHFGSSGSRSSQPWQRVNVFTLHCDICSKTYHSQREFTNHRRRKDFGGAANSKTTNRDNPLEFVKYLLPNYQIIMELKNKIIDAHRGGKGGRGVWNSTPPQANFWKTC